jgi:outer membrane protein OmpA-like peptidoglycan-associated protein
MRAEQLCALPLAALAWSAAVGQGLPAACDVFDGAEVLFEARATALSAVQRSRIAAQVERVHRADYCPFVGLNVIGHASTAEGSPAQVEVLARLRAAYVRDLLVRLGVPKDLVHTDAKGSKQPMSASIEKNARVEVNVMAGCRSATCSFPRSEQGLRLWPQRTK